MKPISLKFKCFGPFMDEQFIDFDDLRSFGLFLITGSTGAGKTTILDAMCMALYGQSSGGKRGELADMRCKLAGADDVTYVEYIFEVDDVRYKFYREAKMARTKLNEAHNCLRFEDGEYVPMMANPKKTTVNEKAVEILQLNADQFRQVVILPQGQFEKLLVSSSTEKEAILTQVFHAERWGKIVDILKQKIKTEFDSVYELKNKITVSLGNEGVESVQALEEKITSLSEDLTNLKAQKSEAEENKKKAGRVYEAALKENKDFEALQKAERDFDKLSQKESAMKLEKTYVEKAKKADAIREIYTAKKAASDAVLVAKKNLSSMSTSLEGAKDSDAKIKALIVEHNAKAAEIEASKKNQTLMENARETYKSLDEKKVALDNATKLEKAALNINDQAVKAYDNAEKQYKSACQLRDNCMATLQESTRIYNLGAAARLGKKLLEEGGACPVCGSTSHPHIAHSLDNVSEVTDADLSKLNKQLGDSTQKVTEAETERNKKKKESEEAADNYKSAQAESLKCQAEYESAKKNLISGIETLKELESAISKVEKTISDYENKSEELSAKKDKAAENLSAAEANYKNATVNLKKAEDEEEKLQASWANALNKEGFVSEAEFDEFNWTKAELDGRNNEVISFERDLSYADKILKECLSKVEGREKPDIDLLKSKIDETENELNNLLESLGRDEGQYKKLNALLGEVKKDYEVYTKKYEHAQKDDEFFSKLSPRSGVSFQRYVLGVMFGSVIDAANRLLEKVQGGRYKLQRTDDASHGNQGGLELEVLDASNGQARGVASLSGGEKFLVALSLAIGLSTVIQAQSRGIRLETMFIDEGFGSLDEKSVGEAVEVLSTVQAGKGVVGVISHVELLRGILPYTIEVFHGEHGNYMRV